MTTSAIGGYFEIALPERGALRYPQAMAFQSARAALLALLRAGKPPCIWMPRLICDSMVGPAGVAGIQVKFYDLTQDLRIARDVEPGRTDWLLYVNFLGLCGHACSDALSRFDPARLILDHAQAYYAAPLPCLATIYSPRKFFGLPDGGLLVTKLAIAAPGETDGRSIERMRHLLIRLNGPPEEGFRAYQLAEETLADMRPMNMSVLTRRLFASYDIEGARARRNLNFKVLHDLLGARNAAPPLALGDVDGPLCYPYGAALPSLRAELIRRRIFVPVYWPEVLQRAARNSVEERWVNSVLALPCDQRYGDDDMKQVAEIVLSLEENR